MSLTDQTPDEVKNMLRVQAKQLISQAENTKKMADNIKTMAAAKLKETAVIAAFTAAELTALTAALAAQ